MLTVGWAGRNVGKTKFVCTLIRKFSYQYPVFALKVSAVFTNENSFHGNHGSRAGDLLLIEEQNISSPKDTPRMLRADIQKVYYLRCDEDGLEKGFRLFLQQVPGKPIIVCELKSLHQVSKPAFEIAIKSEVQSIKFRAHHLLESADLVVISDGVSGFPVIDKIRYSDEGGWRLL